MFSAYWKNLPPHLKLALLRGSSGRDQRLGLARLCLRELDSPSRVASADNPPYTSKLTRLACDFLLAAWEDAPLNAGLAADLLKLSQGVQGAIDPQLKTLLTELVKLYQASPKMVEFQKSRNKGDADQEYSLIRGGMAAEPENLSWCAALWDLGWQENVPEAMEQALARLQALPSLQALAHYLHARFCLALAARENAKAIPSGNAPAASGYLQSALNCLRECRETMPQNSAWLAPQELEAHILRQLRENDAARTTAMTLLKKRPWHLNLALQTCGGLMDAGAATPPDGKISLLLYSYNKSDDLNRTIASVAPDLPRLFKLVVLNNGSNDETAPMLTAWKERLGDKFEIISLPVNVGAPAARNWLCTHDAVAASDYAIYLDDDALIGRGLAPGWLEAFGQALTAYPDASAYGLKILDYHTPWLLQSADLHMTPPQSDDGGLLFEDFAKAVLDGGPLPQESFSLNRGHSQSFEMLNPAQGAADFGGFDYIRPAASVTGCCHLFKTEHLLRDGGFNLVFSPSQCDDLERDLRLAADGKFACYTGFGAIYHLQRTGRGRKMSRAAYGSGLANRYKLAAHFDAERVLGLMRHQYRILESDLLSKLEALDNLA